MAGTVPLSVVIPTLDEAPRLAACLASVAWAAEVIVSDAGSTDATVAVARANGAIVLENTGPTIAAQRNIAITRATHPWVLALDADEQATPELAAELAEVVSAPAHAAYRVRRRSFYLGSELTRGHWGNDWVVRLFPRERRFVEQRVHEALEPVADVGALRGALLHEPYRDLSHHLDKMLRYSAWGAQDLFDRGRRATIWDLAGRPTGRFLRAWLLERSVLDGRQGFISAALGACASFFKYAHLWELGQRR